MLLVSRQSSIKQPAPTEEFIGPSVYEPSLSWDEIERFRHAIREKRLQEFFDYWLAKWKGKAIPRKEDIDPAEIPHLLPHLMLVEPVAGGKQGDNLHPNSLRFRWRLMGSYLVGFAGLDFTGKFLDELPLGHISGACHRLFSIGVRQGRFVMIDAELQFIDNGLYPNKGLVPFRSVALPLSNDGRTVNVLLVMVAMPEDFVRQWDESLKDQNMFISLMGAMGGTPPKPAS